MNRPQLGDHIKAKDRVESQQVYVANRGKGKKWVRHAEYPWHKAAPVEGLFVGYRFVKEGQIDITDEYVAFYATKTIEVWLIAFDARRQFAYVLPEDVIA